MEHCQTPKVDQRVRITKNMLKSALIQLLKEKPLPSVTVKELCASAQINRGTFYTHYYDIYQLMEEIEDEMLLELQKLLQSNPVITSPTSEQSSSFITSIFEFINNNKEMCKILLGDNGDKNFIYKIIQIGRDKCIEEYRELFHTSNPLQAEVFYTFVSHGFLGLIQFWLQNESHISKDSLARSAECIITEGVNYFNHSL